MWVIDIDGVITTAPHIISWLTFHLIHSNQQVIIITSRNPKRKTETIDFLHRNNIYYTEIVFMDEKEERGFSNLAKWKINQIEKYKPLIWIDDNIKEYTELFPERMNDLSTIKIDI